MAGQAMPAHAQHGMPLPTAAHEMPPAGAPLPVSDTLPTEAWTGRQLVVHPAPGATPHAVGPGLPYSKGAWKPPGIAGPWPRDEYLCDGGDFILPAKVAPDFRVDGVEQEDTIAHYDTLDGRRLVEPSNRVCIYAPRFAAVRRVDQPLTHEVHDRVAGFEAPLSPVRYDDLQVATTALQPIQPLGQLGTKAASIYRERQQGGAVARHEHLASMHDAFMPYEDFQVMKIGIYDQAEKARLLEYTAAAITWTKDEAVQVILDSKMANELVGDRRPEVTYAVEEPNSPKLRIIKVASSSSAKPGEVLDFTLRFDNVGDVPIGNVTIIDNLATRLEYVPESQQVSLPAEFFELPNQGGSQALRWEIAEPLKPGEGGIIRFQVRVR